MIFFREKIRRRIIIAFIALICAVQITVPMYQAQALVPVTEIPLSATHIANEKTNTIHTVEDYIKDYILKPLLRVAMAVLIQSLTNQIIAWITGDEGRNVGFVKNLENEIQNQADFRAGEVVNRIIGVNLCSVNLKDFLKLQLTGPFGNYNQLVPQLTCSLTGIVGNVDRFYQNFDNGGWPTFVAIATNPQNNFYGASLVAQINMNAAKGSVIDSLKQKINASGGFQGVQIKKKSQRCETQVDESGEPGDTKCYTVDDVTTPGKLVSESLNKSLNDVGFDFLAADTANIAQNAVNAIITAVVQRLIQEALKGLF